MDLTFQVVFASQECSREGFQCRPNYGQGFAIIVHNNQNVNVALESDNILSGNGLGYEGLVGGALIIEFDFHEDEIDKGDPSYPHISVQYTPKGEEFYKYNQRQSAEHKYSIASKYLMKDILTDEQIHNVRVVYDPHFTELNFKEQEITRSQYLNRLLFS